MKITSILSLILLAAPASAQQRDVSTDLTRARAAFNAADRNKDRQLNAREVGLAGIPHKEFLGADDGDGEWAWGEFLLYYRGLLIQSGQKVHPDLEKELTSIRTGKKVQKAQEVKDAIKAIDAKKAGEKEDEASAGSQSSANEALRKKLNEAKQGVTDRAVDSGATRDDQRAVAEAVRKLEQRAQGASSTTGQTGGGSAADSNDGRTRREHLAGKILEAQKVLQRVVRAGRLKPEEAREFYQVFLGRGVDALNGSGSGSSGSSGPSLRQRVARLRGILQIHINSGRITPAEARNIHAILEERARNAAGVGEGVEEGEGKPAAKTLREKLQEARDRLKKRQAGGGGDAAAAREASKALEERARGAAGSASGSGATDGTPPSRIRNKRVVPKQLEAPRPVKIKETGGRQKSTDDKDPVKGEAVKAAERTRGRPQ